MTSDHAVEERVQRAFAAIDAVNAADPNRLDVRGTARPKALGEGELATEWVRHLTPDPTEALLLAARAHHLKRWEVPRTSYPEGRAGYLRWRRHLHERHAEDVAGILASEDYDDSTIARVQEIIRKRGLGRDSEVQVFEDALCLVFLETEFDDLAAKLEHDKMVDVVRKTLAKMSAPGRGVALALNMGEEATALVREALDTAED